MQPLLSVKRKTERRRKEEKDFPSFLLLSVFLRTDSRGCTQARVERFESTTTTTVQFNCLLLTHKMASTHLQHLCLQLTKTFILLCFLKFAEPSVKWNKNMKSFSHAIKQNLCSPDKEIVIFNYETGPGVLTEQWFTGADCFNEETRYK